MSHKRTAPLIVFIGLGILWVVSRHLTHRPFRPKYLFINQTNDHRHDLALKMSLKLAERRAGIENALILLDHLPKGTSIEPLAADLFQRYRIGQDRGGKGILYLYSARENLFKIEVSYSLEGIFPDATCHRLEQAAQTFMLSEIPQDFLSELLITMNRHAADPRNAAELTFSAPRWLSSSFLSGGAGVRANGYQRTLSDYLAFVRTLPARDLARYGASPSPEETLHLYLDSLERGIGDPNLPLLTEGSQIFRTIVPRNSDQQERVFRYYQKAYPYQILGSGPWRLVVFRAGFDNLPIVLRQGADGLWYVDEPKAWTYFHRFENASDFYAKYDDLPMTEALRKTHLPHVDEPLYAGRVKTPRPPVYPFSLKHWVRTLESEIASHPHEAQRYADLGDAYYFEMDWLTKAISYYEKARALSPTTLSYRWRLWDLYINDSEMEKALAELKYIADHSPPRDSVRALYDYYRRDYTFPPGEF